MDTFSIIDKCNLASICEPDKITSTQSNDGTVQFGSVLYGLTFIVITNYKEFKLCSLLVLMPEFPLRYSERCYA